MKASAEKSSSTPSKSSTHTTNQPFFAKAGKGDFFAPAVQMKMEVNKPDDKFEQEADKMAEKVMRMPAPMAVTNEKLQRAPDDKLQQQAEDIIQKAPLKEDKLQRKGGDEIPAVNEQIQAAIVRKTSGGQPLPRDVRSDMEPRFNADFSKVRVHTDAESASLSNQLSAKAFTYQNHIFFASGQYQPSNPTGKQLLAHELTHTLQQGAVVRREVAISNVRTPVVQRDVINVVKNEIKGGLDSLANTLIPGYTLLNVILGKNIITDTPVSRSGTNIIEGYMNLIPVLGVILMRELRETNSLTEAGIWVEAKVKSFGINFNDIAKRLVMMWDEMSIWYGIDKNVQIFKKYFGSLFATLKAFSGVVSSKVQELRFEAALRLAGATQLLDAMKKNQDAFKRVVEDPSLILTYFMDAMKQGMNNFKNNFDTHFVSVIGQWLLGKAANLGVKMPATFDAMGIFSLVSQLIGLTYDQLRAQIVKKLGPKGEAFIARIEKGEELAEKTLDVIKDLQTKGAVALWDMVKSYLGNIKEMIVSKITALVSMEVIKAAVLKLVSMLNPASAIVQLVMGIYRVVKFFMDKWNMIKLVTNAILDSITKVALHDIKGAASSIEEAMVKGIVLMIGFLTSILGIGDIVDKAIKMIKQLSGMINEAIKKGVDWIIVKVKKIWDSGKSVVADIKDKVTNFFTPQTFKVENEEHKLYPNDDGEAMVASANPVKLIKALNNLTVNENMIKDREEGLQKAYSLKKINDQINNAKETSDKNKLKEFHKENQDKLANEIKIILVKIQYPTNDSNSIILEQDLDLQRPKVFATATLKKITENHGIGSPNIVNEKHRFTDHNKKVEFNKVNKEKIKNNEKINGKEVRAKMILNRRHVVSSDDTINHFNETFNGKTTEEAHKILTKYKGYNGEAKLEPLVQFIRNLFNIAYNDPDNLFFGSEKENQKLNGKVDLANPKFLNDQWQFDINEYEKHIKEFKAKHGIPGYEFSISGIDALGTWVEDDKAIQAHREDKEGESKSQVESAPHKQ